MWFSHYQFSQPEKTERPGKMSHFTPLRMRRTRGKIENKTHLQDLVVEASRFMRYCAKVLHKRYLSFQWKLKYLIVVSVSLSIAAVLRAFQVNVLQGSEESHGRVIAPLCHCWENCSGCRAHQGWEQPTALNMNLLASPTPGHGKGKVGMGSGKQIPTQIASRSSEWIIFDPLCPKQPRPRLKEKHDRWAALDG